MKNSLMKVKKVIEIEAPELGKRIKEAREANKRSLTDLCAAAGMTTANWYRIESEDTKSLPVETLRKIEEVLGVNFGVTFDD
ncbi:helix-turn-helix domain-containing protein [Nostoc sp.]|uniref:helix-turn-helix domain-containing protein n=1 Tax=Nostoc sp. TaxID=1180 RepID=UPI002FFC1A2D